MFFKSERNHSHCVPQLLLKRLISAALIHRKLEKRVRNVIFSHANLNLARLSVITRPKKETLSMLQLRSSEVQSEVNRISFKQRVNVLRKKTNLTLI